MVRRHRAAAGKRGKMQRGQAVRVPEDETPEPTARDRNGAPITPAYANYMLGVLVLV